MDVWANGDKKLYEYAINYLAQIKQTPQERQGTSRVLQGDEGAGKGLIVELQARALGKK